MPTGQCPPPRPVSSEATACVQHKGVSCSSPSATQIAHLPRFIYHDSDNNVTLPIFTHVR